MEVGVDHVVHVAEVLLVRQPLAVVDAENLHPLVVVKVAQELGRDQEVLAAVLLASNVHQRVVHKPLRALVHALVDLVHEREWCPSLFSQRHEIHDRRQRAFASGLTIGSEELQLLALSELDEEFDSPFVVVLVFSDADLACATESCKGSRELLAYALDEAIEGRVPIFLPTVNVQSWSEKITDVPERRLSSSRVGLDSSCPGQCFAPIVQSENFCQ